MNTPLHQAFIDSIGAYILCSTNAFFFGVQTTDVIGCDPEFRAVISQALAARFGFTGIKINQDRPAYNLVEEVAESEVLEYVNTVIHDRLFLPRASHQHEAAQFGSGGIQNVVVRPVWDRPVTLERSYCDLRRVLCGASCPRAYSSLSHQYKSHRLLSFHPLARRIRPLSQPLRAAVQA